GVLLLGKKLGPFLWQFPPNFRFQPELLGDFFDLLPRDSGKAVALAKRHDQVIQDNAGLKVTGEFPIRHAIEVRHSSFVVPEFIHLLRRHRIALVCADSVEWPRLMDVTADFVYLRLHGSKVLYASGYDGKSLDQWAKRVVAWARGRAPKDAEKVISRPEPKQVNRDEYFYFDNDAKVRAPADALALIARINKLLR